jgi:uncharacterized protein YqeY
MLLHETIKNSIKESMKAGDKIRLEVMRGLITAFTNELVATGRRPQEFLTDEHALVVITRLAKQRKDSIDQFTKGNRMDLVEEETAQLKILEEYLPKLMSQTETEEFVKTKIAEMRDLDLAKKGMFMSVLMKELKGKADGGIVRMVVDQLYK